MVREAILVPGSEPRSRAAWLIGLIVDKSGNHTTPTLSCWLGRVLFAQSSRCMDLTESVEVDRYEQRPVKSSPPPPSPPPVSSHFLGRGVDTVSEPMYTTHTHMRTSSYPVSVRLIHLA
jgi:hypothetical protein